MTKGTLYTTWCAFSVWMMQTFKGSRSNTIWHVGYMSDLWVSVKEVHMTGEELHCLSLCCHSQVCQPQPSQLDAAWTTGAGRNSQPWADREFMEGSRGCWVAWYSNAQGARGEKTTKMNCLGQNCKRKRLHFIPFHTRSSNGVGIPFIGSFVSSSSSPVYFIAMIFELLFPVKTFQMLRGRKVLCKQSGVCDVNGLHLLIQGNPIICMCARVQGFQSCICLGSQ